MKPKSGRLTKKIIFEKLKEVPDPELGISIVDLGLIYDAKINKNGHIVIIMTLTSIGCPLFPLIEKEVVHAVRQLGNVNDVIIDLTFDPPWNLDKMSKQARAELGFD